ncbi:MAG TPA: hypothetical protein ENL42_00650 [Thermoplasmatales archaeon]|nr:hypothetical protein [Thermoplasmatales archaeon]
MKIEIKLEGESIDEIAKGLISLIENNREEIKKLLNMLARDAIEVLEEDPILEKGADLYIKLNRAINYRYRKGK